MTKDNIALAALLETKDACWENGVPADPRQPVLVATAHIHWNPEFCNVKLIQTMILLEELRRRSVPVTPLTTSEAAADPLGLFADGGQRDPIEIGEPQVGERRGEAPCVVELGR